MILGTVQLGISYGINNKNGKPELEEAFNILDYAYDHGITTLDTGPMYGDAENIIGRYFTKYSRRFLVNTKAPDIIPKGVDVDEFILTSIKKSLSRLQSKYVDCYFLHQFGHCRIDGVLEAMQDAKKKGIIHNVGISLYYPRELLYIVSEIADFVDVVQIPLNIFSMHEWEDSIRIAKDAGIRIYARSIYLQGLVFMDPADKFPRNIGASEYIRYACAMAGSVDSSIAHFCYDVLISNSHPDDVIVGCESLEQLKSNIALENEKNIIGEEVIQQLNEYMMTIPKDVLDPTTWNNYKKGIGE
ncbi:aldo/keto reductase [bacterium 1XD21-13]|nr:aldo/keto reductase [bacterium 1XD21-13]